MLNAIFGGWADETISSRCYRLNKAGNKAGVFMYAIDFLFFLEKEHCKNAYLSEKKRNHQPVELRD